MLESARPKTPHEALQRFFGYAEFRSGQHEIIQSVLDRHDTLVVMPTGGGKSLCYQIPALLLDGVTIVVSPLIALMKDQVDALNARGIRATTINSMLDFQAVAQRLNDIRYGLYSLVYVAPERFESTMFLEQIAQANVSLLAIDEAHCISEWGHDFRPSYLKLQQAAEHLGRPPIIALTATATPYVQDDIVTQLKLTDPARFVRGFDRPNLSYRVNQTSDKEAGLRSLLEADRGRDGATIIYCGTRRNVEAVGTMLHAERIGVTIYHGGMKDADRRSAQEAFITNRARAIVATNAFGMGIDKADVRHVVHYDMPGSIEAYYQEAGRGGRDGAPSDCTLLYDGQDRRLQEFFIRNSFPTREQIDGVYTALWDMLQVAVGSRYEGVFVPDERQLASRSKVHRASLVTILNVLEKNEVLRNVRADRLGAVRFTASSDEIQQYYQRTRDDERKTAIVALLRTLGGAALSQEAFFNPADVASRYGLSTDAFERHLRALMMGCLLRYTPPAPGRGVQFLAERLPARSLRIDERAIERSRERALEKLDVMERYVGSRRCRRNFILEYFGAGAGEQGCGRCDVCRGIAAQPAVSLSSGTSPRVRRAEDLLLTAAEELGGRFGKMTLVDLLRGQATRTVEMFNLADYPRYGELSDHDRADLGRLAEGLIAEGLLERSAALKPTVRLTIQGRRRIRHMSPKSFRFATQDGFDDGEMEQVMADIDSPETDFERTLPHRLRRTWRLWNEGYTLEEIAGHSALQPSTVSTHVEDLIEAGAEIDVQRILSDGILRQIRQELEKMPRATLRELRALLGGSVGYPELRIATAWVRAEARGRQGEGARGRGGEGATGRGGEGATGRN